MTMTDERTVDVRTLAFVLLAAALGLGLFAPTASAQAACTDVLENRSGLANDSSAPGGLLADAIGDQRDQIGSELDDSELDARLENASSTRARARIISDAVERIEANVSTVERCWGINRSVHTANRSLARLDTDERRALTNYTRSLRGRLNETRTAARELPAPVRAAHGVDAETLAALERRIVAVRNATAPRATSTTGGQFPPR